MGGPWFFPFWVFHVNLGVLFYHSALEYLSGYNAGCCWIKSVKLGEYFLSWIGLIRGEVLPDFPQHSGIRACVEILVLNGRIK